MPRGAALIISPWNYPLQLALVPVVNALAAGNTVILKPSEITAETGLFIEKAVQLAGFPDGVIQVVHGGKETGQALVKAKPDFIFLQDLLLQARRFRKKPQRPSFPLHWSSEERTPSLFLKMQILKEQRRQLHGVPSQTAGRSA